MVLQIRFDETYGATLWLIGYALPQSILTPPEFLLTYIMINYDDAILVVYPSRCQDHNAFHAHGKYQDIEIGRRPAKWHLEECHYIIEATDFARRLYQDMGWEYGVDYSIPALKLKSWQGSCLLDDLNGVEGDYEAMPLFFKLDQADILCQSAKLEQISSRLR